MYEALVQQRHRELVYVVRMVGGVVETRYQAGRGKAPFEPLEPARQRQALAFLLTRAFEEPKRLLDPEVLYRVAPSNGDAPLQGSNVDLMKRLLDPAVFGRMREASAMGRGRYTGLDMLYDLNDGLFSELARKAPAVSPYRRQLQRSYVAVLLAAAGTIQEPSSQSANIDSSYVDSGSKKKSNSQLKSLRQFDSALADVGVQYATNAGALSEYRALLRDGVAHLYKKIDKALPKITDPDTRTHLRLIQARLNEVP
jgi:hypothetical protein